MATITRTIRISPPKLVNLVDDDYSQVAQRLVGSRLNGWVLIIFGVWGGQLFVNCEMEKCRFSSVPLTLGVGG